MEWGFSSVDGSKFQTCNGKDRNFTKNKLDDHIKWLDAHTEEYLRILEEMDEEEAQEGAGSLSREEIEEKLKKVRERLERYEGYQKLMEETGISQLSLTDPDAKLMKSKNGFIVAYNPQTAVDSETHLIRDFEMTNRVTDHGLLDSVIKGIRKETEGEILETDVDKGYEDEKDLIHCLENGIIAHVITADGKDGYELEIPYEENDADINSTDPEELKKCLRAGKIPEAYREVITGIEAKEVRRKTADEPDETPGIPKSRYGTQDEMKRRAGEGYFVHNSERNLVYCPMGEILRQKCIKKMVISGTLTKMHAGIVRTGINVIKAKMNGRRSILPKIAWRNPAGIG